MIDRLVLIIFIWFIAGAFQTCQVKSPLWDAALLPLPPRYEQDFYWASLPAKKDSADKVPSQLYPDNQALAKADVFFLHPTTYTQKMKKGSSWNADVNDTTLNNRTDQTTIQYQASIFNGAGKVYAPRYRQAHLKAYFDKNNKHATDKAFALAYRDIKKAFQYYLEHFNQGRPIIIAAHSQGASHGIKLLEEFFDGIDHQKQLIVAYLVGMPVLIEQYKTIKPCVSAEDIHCYCSWQTYKKGHYSKYQPKNSGVLATNPLTWITEENYAPKSLNLGGVLRNFNRVFPELADAQVHDGLLWINKPKFPGSFFVWTSRYHIVDYNLYYFNVRQNAIDRVNAYYSKY